MEYVKRMFDLKKMNEVIDELSLDSPDDVFGTWGTWGPWTGDDLRASDAALEEEVGGAHIEHDLTEDGRLVRGDGEVFVEVTEIIDMFSLLTYHAEGTDRRADQLGQYCQLFTGHSLPADTRHNKK